MYVCLCCTPPANSNSSVASEQEERGSLKTQIQRLHNQQFCSSQNPHATNTLLLHPLFLLPPTPAGRAHPSSSSPPIATAHLSSPPSSPDQHTLPHSSVSILLHLLPGSLPPPPRFHQTLPSLTPTSSKLHLKLYFYLQQDYEPGILTRVKTRNSFFALL